MSTIIYLIRHTQTIGNVEKRLTGRNDYEVTDQGYEYIDRLTEKLKDIKFDVAYSSISKRTYKTIEKLAKLNNLEIHETEELCEMNFGKYDGMKWEDVNKINPNIKKLQDETNEIMTIPEQETTEEVEDRMMKEMVKIAKENLGKTVLICSHGVAIEAFLRMVTGETRWVDRKDEYSQRTTSINVVSFDESTESFKVEKLNDFSHIIS